VRLDLSALVQVSGSVSETGRKALFYLEVEHDLRQRRDSAERLLRRPGARLVEGPGRRRRIRYRCTLGRFDRTRVGSLSTVTTDHGQGIAYVTRKGNLALAVDHVPAGYGNVRVRRLRMSRGILTMRGDLGTGHCDLQSAELVLKGRTTGRRITQVLDLEPDDTRTRRRYGLRHHRFRLRLDWGDQVDRGLRDDTYDAWVSLSAAQHPDPIWVRIGRTRFLVRYLTRPGWARCGDRAVSVTPYYTYKANKTSFQVDQFDLDALRHLRRRLHLGPLLRAVHRLRRARPVWLVGERPGRAQDTGFHFFRYLREHHPEIDAYYVIDPASPEYGRVEPLGNVLPLRSRDHISRTLVADRVIGSHHPDYLYPLRTRRFRRVVSAPKVFLQHGIMGTKHMADFYGRSAGGFTTDLFLVSSDREKKIIVEDFGYRPEEVRVTGLSRFDSLLADDVPVRRQLLVIPTWRDWLNDADTYLESEYHARWSQLLHHPRLRALAEKQNVELVFCLHPNMQRYAHLFADVPARVITEGGADVQHLLKESALLVTDFSSVGFDFGLLHRPVVYYQFDRQRFLGPRGSHLDLDNELPGPIHCSVDSLLEEIERLVARDFTMDVGYVARADRFLTHRDRNSCERIFQACRDARRRRSPRSAVTARELSTALFRVFRFSRWYYPTIRVMMRVLSWLPADEQLVVFESGMGSQYADSPRYIYEELLRRGSDLRKVWAYRGKIHANDPRTRTVKRLSPSYFYALGRAKYWVNNQSFPSFLERRPDGVYLQTWHGTPLKRMLHDLDTINGRDRGYLDRATHAAQQWSVLVSPSPFVTEIMRSAFRYQGEVSETGYPRNDLFLRPDRDEISARVRANLGISAEATVVLYAPTFRDDRVATSGPRGRFTFDLPLDLERLQQTLGDEIVLLVRLHVLVRSRIRIPESCQAVVRDVSTHPEIQELCLASDALVTDYSSVMFDYSILQRPMIFFAPDLEHYRDRLRGFYLDYEQEVPGPVVTTEDALYKALSTVDLVAEEYHDRRQEFRARFCPRDDGHAAERIVDAVFGRPRDEG
jgi:CDP-glycerol glycerophosphotransferase